MSYVLFSPIGMSDPISNSRDAAWLHIMRFYRPRVCVAYMSAAICEVEDVTGSLHYALEQLNEHLFGQNESMYIHVEWMRDEECVAAHSLEYFFPKFRAAIEDLHARYPDDTILVNVTSGTMGMQAALMSLRELSPFPVTLVQVRNDAYAEKPEQRKREIKEIDLDAYWLDNKDNLPGQPIRVSEQPLLNYALQMNIRRICDHVEKGDYHTALALADDRLPMKARFALQGAQDRVCMRLDSAGHKLDQSGLGWGKTLKAHAKDRLWQCVEYFLSMEIDEQNGEVDDLLRKLTPLLYNISILYAAEIGLDVLSDDYSRESGNTRKWKDFSDMQPWMQEQPGLRESCKGFLAAEGIIKLIRCRVDPGDATIGLLERLRDVERSVRNVVAHEIVAYRENMVGKMAVNIHEIMNKLRDVLKHLARTAKLPESCLTEGYKPMNKHIIALLNAAAEGAA